MKFFYEHLNVDDYADNKWLKNGTKYQIDTLNKTTDLIKHFLSNHGISVYNRGNLLAFNCAKPSDFRMKVGYVSGKDYSFRGGYDYKKEEIIFNKDFISDDGCLAFASVCHENTHGLESAISQHINEYKVNSIEYEYLEMLKGELFHEIKEMESFGIKINTPSYLNPIRVDNTWGGIAELAQHFYALQPSERSACSVESSALKHALLVSRQDKDSVLYNSVDLALEKASNAIRKRYGSDLTYNEICELFDNAKLNLLHKRIPSTSKEAAMTYDLAVCFKIQMFTLEKDMYKKVELEEECRILLNPHYRREKLASYYKDKGATFVAPYDDVKINGVKVLNNVDNQALIGIEELKNLQIKGQIENPKAVALAIFGYGKKAIDFVQKEAFEPFRMWYFSESNDLSEDEMNDIAEAFDEIKYGDRKPTFVAVDGEKVSEYSFEGQKIKKSEYESRLSKGDSELAKRLDLIKQNREEYIKEDLYLMYEKDKKPFFFKFLSKNENKDKKKINKDDIDR